MSTVPSSPRPAPSMFGITSANWMGRVAAVTVAYIVIAYFSRRWGLMGPLNSTSGIATGFALAALVHAGPKIWPGIAAGSLISSLIFGDPAWVAIGTAAGCAATTAIVAGLLRQLTSGFSIDSRPSLIRPAVIGGVVAGGIVSLNETLWVLAASNVPHNPWLSAGWGLVGSNSLAASIGCVLMLLPLLALHCRSDEVPRARYGPLPAVLLGLAVLCASIVGVWLAPNDGSAGWSAWLFLPHLLLLWQASRGGLFATSSSALIAGFSVATATVLGLGPFALSTAGNPVQTQLLLWSYVASLGAIGAWTSPPHDTAGAGDTPLRRALASAQVGVADWDLQLGRGALSARWCELLARHQGNDANTIDAWLAQVHEDDRPRLQSALDALHSRDCSNLQIDLRIQGRDGHKRWLNCRGLVTRRGATGEPLQLVAWVLDVSNQHMADERQRLSTHLFQHLHEGLLVTDAQYRVLDVNPTYTEITGRTREELLGTVPTLLQSEPHGNPAGYQRALWQSLRDSGAWQGEVVDRRANGDPCTLRVTLSTVQGPGNSPKYLVLVISDITQQRLQLEQIERQAHFDELTRLPNRARLSLLLNDAMAASEREGFLLAVCYVDLDRFKPVNERYGRAGGDRLLVDLASRLRNSLRSGAHWADSLARLGGDEFVVLVRASSLDECRDAVERLLRVITQPYVIGPKIEPVEITASVGATVYPLDHSDAETLLRHADHAMYGAKQAGRNGYLFFDPERSRRTEARVVAVGRVEEALDAKELQLYFQPKVNMRSGQVLGVEALLRWMHPEHGIIGPTHFLPLIEHTVLGARIGDWVLEQGIEQLAQWLRMGLDISVSVNVSARHLQTPDFAERLETLLAPHGSPVASRLELEVLETAALADIDYTSELMERCRSSGVRFSLDDFGTGYSNLTYLKRLPVDVLKIDRSFVSGMLYDKEDLAIVEGVIGLAHTFNCMAVAEGVETVEQARRLISIGCDIGQGMGIASPMPAQDIYGWVRAHRGMLSGPQAVAI